MNKKTQFDRLALDLIVLNLLKRDYEVEEQGKIVIYTTTLQVVRESNAKCKRVKKILQSYCVRYEERDLYKKKEYQRELKYRLNLNIIDIPYIFFNGKLIGVSKKKSFLKAYLIVVLSRIGVDNLFLMRTGQV